MLTCCPFTFYIILLLALHCSSHFNQCVLYIFLCICIIYRICTWSEGRQESAITQELSIPARPSVIVWFGFAKLNLCSEVYEWYMSGRLPLSSLTLALWTSNPA